MSSWLNSLKMGPFVISALVVAGFIGVLVLLILKPVQLGNDIADVLKILVGMLSTQFGAVVQYHIGSSAGSKDKDSVLHNIAVNAAQTGKTTP